MDLIRWGVRVLFYPSNQCHLFPPSKCALQSVTRLHNALRLARLRVIIVDLRGTCPATVRQNPRQRVATSVARKGIFLAIALRLLKVGVDLVETGTRGQALLGPNVTDVAESAILLVLVPMHQAVALVAEVTAAAGMVTLVLRARLATRVGELDI